MAENSKIEWTDATWNPWYGCLKVSPGCKLCYMYREMKQYGRNPMLVTRSKTKFNDPLKWVRSGKPPKMCFTCSWSDFFIEQADGWRAEAWKIIHDTPQITYQILTKRPERIAKHLPADWEWGYKNVWLGVSVELAEYRHRIYKLQQVQARTRFISFEPLLGDILETHSLNLLGIDWAIVGGESGPDARPMNVGWARSLLYECRDQGVAFFMKQGSAANWDHFKDFDSFPKDLQVREYPTTQETP